MAKKNPVTLAVDIGGTGLKVILLSPEGQPLSERLRVVTPDPATPARLLNALDHLRAQLGSFDRVSVGYPGVVKHGVVLSAANLHPKCIGFPLQAELEKRWRKPVPAARILAVERCTRVTSQADERPRLAPRRKRLPPRRAHLINAPADCDPPMETCPLPSSSPVT